MKYIFTGLSVMADNDACCNAATLFCEEIQMRTGKQPNITKDAVAPCVIFRLEDEKALSDKDSYTLRLDDGVLTIAALGLRGLIFGYSYFLRKTVYDNSQIVLIRDISGKYEPRMKIRGHQLGYRTTTNTYDAWDHKDYARYYRDMMFFGCNTCEHIPNEHVQPKKNWLMKYAPEDMLVSASALADELDMDISVWYPNNEEDIATAVERRKKVFDKTPRIDAVFPPGGDPGEFPADEFLDRCRAISKALKQTHPRAQMWPSAQKPRSIPDWGEDFLTYMNSLPDDIDGIITGPNRAFTLHELRRRLPAKYPIRLYPDITHNVRCEYPVHYNHDDWHYALASTMGRESINPRPAEYRLIHRTTRQYIIGSVSYSEGVNDDINKMVWSDMDFFPNVSLYETLQDYARVFMYGVPAETVADGILGLELNWYGDPSENPGIENTLSIWQKLREDYPFLSENWRFNQCLFRAKCDALVRRRRLFETALVEDAKIELNRNHFQNALDILSTDFDDEYYRLRADIFALADVLFHQIGIQLDVENYGADNSSRGATLDTIDLPVSDRPWLLNRLKKALAMDELDAAAFVQRVLRRNTVAADELYFSLAEHGFDVLGTPQKGEFYIDFQGDRPKLNNGQVPMCVLKLYDHYTLQAKLGGFTPGVEYKLRVTFSASKIPVLKHHHVIVNGNTIYDGPQYGGERDEQFDEELLAPGFESATYRLPADVFENGCIDLEIGEPIAGVMLSEFWILRNE